MIFEARGIETLYRAHFRACFNKKFTQTKARQRHKVTRLHLRSHINTPTFLPSKQLKTRAQENSFFFTNFLLQFFIKFSFFPTIATTYTTFVWRHVRRLLYNTSSPRSDNILRWEACEAQRFHFRILQNRIPKSNHFTFI